jgi:hypothetical protein
MCYPLFLAVFVLASIPVFSQIPMDRVPDSLKKNGVYWAGDSNYDPQGPQVKDNGELDYKAAVAGHYKPSDIIFVLCNIMNIENHRSENTVYYWVSAFEKPDQIFLVISNKIQPGWKKLGKTAFLASYNKTVGATITDPQTAEEKDISVPALTLLIGGLDDLLPRK